MDLKAYHSQIKELIPLRNEPDFNQLLDKILFGENNSDKFLIKMELSRLAKPCQRILDIRDKVTEPCILFEQGKIKHYLTVKSITILQQNIQFYGCYTVGAFEAVHEYIRKEKNRQNTQNTLQPLKIIKKEQCESLSFSQKNKRGAPRMFFISEVTLTLDGSQTFKAQTSNISLTGVKVKLKDNAYVTNDTTFAITFNGLALEYHDMVLKEPITYQLVKQESDDDYYYYYLNYKDNNKCFSKFLGEFIRLNQYKYKIDVHYYYQLAKISALKHSYLEKMSILPIYLDANSSAPFLFALKSNTNKQLLKEWHCEGIEQLPILFHELRFIKLISHINKQHNSTVYTFTHTVKGIQYFLSASEDELLETGLKETFIRYGRSKENWRVYHLTIKAYQYQASYQYDITEPAPAIFKKITHIATLQRLSNDYPFYIETKLNKDNVNRLNQFVHRTHNTTTSTEIFTLLSDEQRKEPRYVYTSKLSILDENSSYNGQLIDFSESGLKIKLDQITAFSTSTKLIVNLTELQKISLKYPLSQLQYKVVSTSAHNILHLQVSDQKTLDICQRFFPILIKNNAKHFTCVPLKEAQQPTSKHLVEIAEESFNNAIFFVSNISTRPKITFSAIDIQEQPLLTLFSLHSDNRDQLNYYPLANNHLYERLVIQPLREGEKSPQNKEAIIYIKAVKDNKQQWKISSFLDEDFESQHAKTNFIKESQLNASFYALHFRLTPSTRMNLNSIQSEIHAISRFAIHLTKKLEEELYAVEAIIEITDRTTDIINSIENLSGE